MLMSLIFSMVIGILVLICWWYILMIKCMWPLRKVPGPTNLPIIGCAYLFPNVQDLLSSFFKLTKLYGPICKMMIGTQPYLLISDYEALKSILRSSTLIDKSKNYRHLHTWLGTGLVTSSGQKWRSRRKLLTPSYHFKILDAFLPIFDSVSNLLGDVLQKEVGKTFDIYPYMILCTLDIICETAMGTSVDALINCDSEYVKAVKEMCCVAMDKAFSPLQQQQWTFQFTKNYKRERKALKILNEFTMNVIRKRRNKLDIESEKDKNSEVEEITQKIAFLDLLLQTKVDDQPLTDKDIMDEVSTFMFAGHDTTASALSFALYCIAGHPKVQNQIIEEQREIFGDDQNRLASYKELNEMKYLELVIKETLRLYPSAPFYERETKEQVKIGSILVPKNVSLAIFAMAIQRDPNFFPEPDKFQPERFAENRETNHLPYSYIPFSAGPRNCIGQKFAMLEMKSVLSKVLRRYELYPSVTQHELQLISETILKSANGIKLRMEERKF